MRRPTRNLLYVVLGFVCAALLAQGVGLKLPRVVNMLSAVWVAAPSSAPAGSAASSVGVPALSAAATVSSAAGADKACTASSAIEMRFNAAPIAEGNTIWFNSAISVEGGLGAEATTVFVNDAMITFAANGSSYSLAVPAAAITFDPAATAARASYDATSGRWATVVPAASASKAFLSGLAFPVPAGGLPGGISRVTWSGSFSTDTPGVTARWGWGAAVYTSFASDYNALGIQAVDEGRAGHEARTLSARTGDSGSGAGRFVAVGKPARLAAFVIGGASGLGGSDFTGSYGTVSDVTPCAAGAFFQRTRSYTTITVPDRTSSQPLIRGMGATKSCPLSTQGGASIQCSYVMVNIDPDFPITDLVVSNTIPDPLNFPNECPGEATGTTPLQCLQPANTGVPVTTLGPAGSPTDTCGNLISETAPPCTSSDCNFTDRVFGMGIDTGITVSASVGGVTVVLACTPTPTTTPVTPTNTPTNTPTDTPTNTPTNTPTPQAGQQGCTPGYWKQPQHFDSWCGGYTPGTLVSSTGLATDTCGCDFSGLTMIEALGLSSGRGICAAEGKLYQMAVAALLNACSVAYPLSTAQIVGEVNAALASCDRTTILNEASRLNAFNSLGCPLN